MTLGLNRGKVSRSMVELPKTAPVKTGTKAKPPIARLPVKDKEKAQADESVPPSLKPFHGHKA